VAQILLIFLRVSDRGVRIFYCVSVLLFLPTPTQISMQICKNYRRPIFSKSGCRLRTLPVAPPVHTAHVSTRARRPCTSRYSLSYRLHAPDTAASFRSVVAAANLAKSSRCAVRTRSGTQCSAVPPRASLHVHQIQSLGHTA